jgi:hypothetical protein
MKSDQARGFAGGGAIKAYAATMADEPTRRSLNLMPIEWLPK